MQENLRKIETDNVIASNLVVVTPALVKVSDSARNPDTITCLTDDVLRLLLAQFQEAKGRVYTA